MGILECWGAGQSYPQEKCKVSEDARGHGVWAGESPGLRGKRFPQLKGLVGLYSFLTRKQRKGEKKQNLYIPDMHKEQDTVISCVSLSFHFIR